MGNRHLKADPQAEREAARYAAPIPSREYILQSLSASAGPLTYDELCATLELRDPEGREALRRRLRAMVRDGQLIENRSGGYGVLGKMNLLKGRVSGHPEGYGFVITGGGEPDIFLSSRQMRRVMSGDLVVVRIAGFDRRGRPEGSIVEVLEHGTQELVGRYFTESGIHFVRPDNPAISQDVLIAPEDTGGANAGQIVLVEITRQPSRYGQAAGRIARVLGEHLAPGMEIEVAIHNFGLPHVWPEAVGVQVKKLPARVRPGDCQGRFDLRETPLVTIDGEDARDFDDAVYCERLRGGGWRLLVAIADVAHYVAPGSALDQEAWQRGNSVYFPGHVVPMLPEALSNGLCSLNPEVDRLCLVCELRVDRQGGVKSFEFFEAVMHSRARLTYTQVAALMAQREQADSPVRAQFRNLVGHIDALQDLYLALRGAREARGAIDFETGETRILFDAGRKIERIVPSERTDAHRLIEECMLAANVCAAQLLERSKQPVLYRVHEGPQLEKLANLREFLGELGLGLPGGDEPAPEDFQAVLKEIAGRPDAAIIQSVMLRSMSQARYQPDNLGHFGLNYPAYAHFTSPIRRYPDLLVHRAIRALLRGNGRNRHLRRHPEAQQGELRQFYPYDAGAMDSAGIQCSMTERRADEATRSVVHWLKCEYLLEHVGDRFLGVVVGVTSFGLFVELEELYVEGLVHITNLPKDYYHHEPAHHRLIGERTRRAFRLGDRLEVQVARVDLDERKVDFELIDSLGGVRRKRGDEAPGAERSAPRKTAGRGKARGASTEGKGAAGKGAEGKGAAGKARGTGTARKGRGRRR